MNIIIEEQNRRLQLIAAAAATSFISLQLSGLLEY
jgi:hypothetical protein